MALHHIVISGDRLERMLEAEQEAHELAKICEEQTEILIAVGMVADVVGKAANTLQRFSKLRNNRLGICRFDAELGRGMAMNIFVYNSVGHVTGGMQVTERVDGSWLATCPIGNLFGEEVDGEHTAFGETKEAAVLALEKEIVIFDNFMWM